MRLQPAAPLEGGLGRAHVHLSVQLPDALLGGWLALWGFFPAICSRVLKNEKKVCLRGVTSERKMASASTLPIPVKRFQLTYSKQMHFCSEVLVVCYDVSSHQSHPPPFPP